MALQFSHVALVCTVALIGTTTWLAIEGRNEVSSERIKRQFAESQLAAAQNTAKTGGSGLTERLNQVESRLSDLDRDQNVLASETSALKSQTRELTQKIGKDENGLPPLPPEEKVVLAPPPIASATTAPAPAAAVVPAEPATVTATPVAPTPAQERILAAKPLGTITNFYPDNLLVEIAGGAKQGLYEGAKYQIRRERYLIGEVTITDVADAEAAGAFTASNSNAAPKAGDEVIEPLK